MFRLLITAILFVLCPGTTQAVTRRKQPSAAKVTHISGTTAKRNVLLILVDDLAANACGPELTPNMAKLAAKGMRFTNAQAAHVRGNASRIALFTGLLPSSSGVFRDGQDWHRSVQLQGRLTLPALFAAGGYATAAGGSVFESSHGGQPSAELDALWEQRLPGITQLSTTHVNGLNIWDWGSLDALDAETGDGQTVAWAVDYLAAAKAKKLFFLTVGIDKPHAPWYAPGAYLEGLPASALQLPEVSADDLDDVPAIAKRDLAEHAQIVAKNVWPDAVRAYRASVAFADAQVGLLMKALEKNGAAKTTIVCLTSTRSIALGEKQNWQAGGLWGCCTHVPLIIVAPGVTQPGSVSDEPVSLVDLYPTLADLTKQEVTVTLDGTSLLPVLLDPATKREKPAITVMGGAEQAGYAVRSEAWRYIRYADGSEELYAHDTDPHEWRNVANKPEHAAVKQTLAAFIPQKWHSSERSLEQMAGRPGADGSINFDLQCGDKLPADIAPQLSARGIDVDVSFDYSPETNQDSTLVAQGDAQNGWALHLVAGLPTATIICDGKATSITTDAPQAGLARLRLFIPGNGTMSLAVSGQTDIVEQSPFVTGFPAQPAIGLTVGEAFAPLTGTKAFNGEMHHVWLTVLAP